MLFQNRIPKIRQDDTKAIHQPNNINLVSGSVAKNIRIQRMWDLDLENSKSSMKTNSLLKPIEALVNSKIENPQAPVQLSASKPIPNHLLIPQCKIQRFSQPFITVVNKKKHVKTENPDIISKTPHLKTVVSSDTSTTITELHDISSNTIPPPVNHLEIFWKNKAEKKCSQENSKLNEVKTELSSPFEKIALLMQKKGH
jgi:50S ribosomal subunit-associated GTPase HflX